MAGDAELAELRRTELEALTSILGADFRVLQQTAWGSAATSQPQTCEVVLRPEEDQQKDQVAVVAHLVLTKTYPNTAPTVVIRAQDPQTRGVSPEQLKQLGDAMNVHARSLLGAEMIWELVSLGQEFISLHNTVGNADPNVPKPSLEEQMRQRGLEEQKVRPAARRASLTCRMNRRVHSVRRSAVSRRSGSARTSWRSGSLSLIHI